MKKILLTLACLVSFIAQAQDLTDVNGIWEEGSQWDVYYTVESEDPSRPVDSIRVTYLLRPAEDGYMALEKRVNINKEQEDTLIQGYIRNENDTVIYVRPVREDGSIGEECLLYDFRESYEYGNTIRYGVMGGEVKEEIIDWRLDSLDYYMLKNGDSHCLAAWKGIVYKYGYLGGPMSLFLMEAAPGKTRNPKATNISHVIFTTKGGHKIRRIEDVRNDDDITIPYDEMLTTGTTWECLAVCTEQPANMDTYKIYVKGDTIIANRQCRLVYSPKCNTQMAMFEEGRKVYVVNSDDNPEVLLDFGLQEGDRLNEVENAVSIDTQENQGHDYKIITIDTGLDCYSYFVGDTEPWNYYLIEGIGVNKDEHLVGHHFLNEEHTFSYLLRCWKNDRLVYQTPGCETITGISGMRTTAQPHIYDIQGRRMNAIPQKGIYINGNKKIIIK